MYNIKQAATRAGVTVPVLRAWERRYGIVSPPRTASGYRRFDDGSVARIRAMRRLVDDGWSPSAAAAAILAGEVPVGTGDGVALVEGAEGADAAVEISDRMVAAARAQDVIALEATVDELFSRGSFERVADDLLFPALQRLGDAWARGEISVAGEHLASAAVHRRLSVALEAAGSAGTAARVSRRPRIVVGLPPGARHELGALAFAIAARRSGLLVAYVGADLPVADWVEAARAAGAAAVGVVTARDRKPALDVARALRAADPDLVIAFGGAAAPNEPGVVGLPAPLPAAVATLADALD